ncbi:hypothetical protein B0T22DRAFT_478343 [Podospora appendiculata]|uniref:Uncharacterized protein n=1 Tax=Podospora appendiculata TaxID=314037 RepID=A0AAE0XLI7_9PEZI|nr:hypothetical protein B0T22DRAFT_478343 [Podospora appendiculata]
MHKGIDNVFTRDQQMDSLVDYFAILPPDKPDDNDKRAGNGGTGEDDRDDFSQTVPPFDSLEDLSSGAGDDAGDMTGGDAPRASGPANTHFDAQYYRRIHGEPSGYFSVENGDDDDSAGGCQYERYTDGGLYDPFSQTVPVFERSADSSEGSEDSEPPLANDTDVGNDGNNGGKAEEEPEHPNGNHSLAEDDPDSVMEPLLTDDEIAFSDAGEEEPLLAPSKPAASHRGFSAGGATHDDGSFGDGASPPNDYTGRDAGSDAAYESHHKGSDFSLISSSHIWSCNDGDETPCMLSDDGFALIDLPAPVRHGVPHPHTPVQHATHRAYEVADSSPQSSKSSLSPHAPVFHYSGQNQTKFASRPETPPIIPQLPLPPQSLQDWKFRYSDPMLIDDSWNVTSGTGCKRGGRLPSPKRVMGLLDKDEMFAGESSFSPENPIWNYSFWKFKYLDG